MDACPVDAITMEMADDTFTYPKVNREKCRRCGRCEVVCREASNSTLRPHLDCFAAVTNDQGSFALSSSGGAFSVIVAAVYAQCKESHQRLFVAGVTYLDSLKVGHDIVEYRNADSIQCFCSSKYVQSDARGIYRRVASLLNDSANFVVFSGTPCQAAGLYSFLNDHPKNLFVIDLLCHGAPSQYMFDKYKKGFEIARRTTIKSYRFRCKERLDNGTKYTRSVRIELADGRVLRLSRLEDDYLRLFYSKLPKLRESCVTCSFKNESRIGDITIGDAWGIDKIHAELHPTEGVSLVLPISDRALRLMPYITEHMTVYPCLLKDVMTENSFAVESKNDVMDERSQASFYCDMRNDDLNFEEVIEKWKKVVK